MDAKDTTEWLFSGSRGWKLHTINLMFSFFPTLGAIHINLPSWKKSFSTNSDTWTHSDPPGVDFCLTFEAVATGNSNPLASNLYTENGELPLPPHALKSSPTLFFGGSLTALWDRGYVWLSETIWKGAVGQIVLKSNPFRANVSIS